MSKKRFAPKLKIKKGDTVVVIAGVHKGDSGEVLEIFPDKNRAIVSDINLKKKHRKPTQDQPGEITDIPASIHISNLMLMEGGTATRIGRRVEDGKLVRYSKKSGNTIR